MVIYVVHTAIVSLQKFSTILLNVSPTMTTYPTVAVCGSDSKVNKHTTLIHTHTHTLSLSLSLSLSLTNKRKEKLDDGQCPEPWPAKGSSYHLLVT